MRFPSSAVNGRGIRSAVLAIAASTVGIPFAFGHGDGAPQPVDTTGLETLGDAWRQENPYRGNARAIEIGARGYNGNCARCHGLEVKSGGLAPDLRYLEEGPVGDAWFLGRIRNGARVGDSVRMPPFEGLLSQEAMWAIRSYIDSVPED